MANGEYPSKYETEAVLKDGSRVLLRPIRPQDKQEWLDFMNRLDPHARYLYFRVPKDVTEEDAMRACTVDYKDTFAFAAEARRGGRTDIVAMGRYHRLPGKDSAEVRFLVAEPFRGKGIGTRLVEQLVRAARDNGISVFEAEVMSENEDVTRIFVDYGFHLDRKIEEGGYRVVFPIAPTAEVTEKEWKREHLATVNSLRSVLCPRSVAVIGASREQGSIGELLLHCIMDGHFAGVVYPVNPKARAVLSVKAYPSVLDIPDDVDMAIIAIPAPAVAGVADECGRKGVRAMVIISDGFREIGGEGVERERIVREIALGYGMRVVGPNCMGIINTDPQVKLNGTFSRAFPPAGNIAFLSQSGALGLAILEYANRLKLGLSNYVSIGNRADISSNDLLEYWEEDKATQAILLYMESFGNPRKFGRIARRVSLQKPIIAIKGGRTAAGSRAAASHTGALATSTTAIEALFTQAGIIRVDTLQQAFAAVSVLSRQPVPRGNRLAILTNGGGPGIIAADAAATRGLGLPEFSPEVAARLKATSRKDVSINNPLDLTASATEEEFSRCLEILADDPSNDAVIVISIPPVTVDPHQTQRILRQAVPAFKERDKPLIACFIGRPEAAVDSDIESIPAFTFPEEAVTALSHAAEYGQWLRKPKGALPDFPDIERKQARTIIERALTGSSERPLWLPGVESKKLLDCYRIHVVETVFAATADQAAEKASELGFPVAVKLASRTVAHKTEVGGIILDLHTTEDVKRAFTDIRQNLLRHGREKEMDGVIVQRMVKGGVEAIAGVAEDPSFGPLIMFGMGGVHAELLRDVSVSLHPLTDVQAREMIDSLRMSELLKGWRGAPLADLGALEEMLLRLSLLVEDIAEIMEIDLNPVAALPQGQGYRVLDAKVRLK